MSEMVKRVAGAIASAAFQSEQIPPIEIGQDAALVIARAAIEAMREPTPEMIAAGGDAVYNAGGPPTKASDTQAKAAWVHMIETALSK